MKKIIDHKSYDTATAREVGDWDNGLMLGDLDFCAETLYKKRTGEYFLYGEGGPRSRYSKQTGNNEWSGADAIIPLDYSAAEKWAAEHMPTESYAAEFGPVDASDSDDSVAVTFHISAAAKVKLDRAASKQGKTRGEIVDGLIMGIGE
jgi:hypothetical protein